MVGMLMLALLGLALCVQGVYAVATGTAASRGHELAVRSALGASPARLVWHMTRELTMALLIGAASGHAAAVTARSVVEQWLGTPDVRQGELTAIATVALGLMAAVGCYLPTRAAVRTNPTDLLRQG
jgi:ABC-type lipoprotein release transport system permease subunit